MSKPTPPLSKLEGKPLTLEVLIDTPDALPIIRPLREAQFCKLVARPKAMADGSPAVLIVIPLPPTGGTVVAQVGLRSFLEAADLLRATFGTPSGTAMAKPKLWDYRGPLSP